MQICHQQIKYRNNNIKKCSKNITMYDRRVRLVALDNNIRVVSMLLVRVVSSFEGYRKYTNKIVMHDVYIIVHERIS